LANSIKDDGMLNGTGIDIQSEGDAPGGPKSLAALASGSVDVAGVAAPAAHRPGYGLARHAFYNAHDIKFWLAVPVREGKLKPEDIATNTYNANAQPGHN
jgi:hypothetical protein